MVATLYRADTNAVWQEQGMTVVTNSDQSVSFQLADGSFAGCEPAFPGQPTLYIPHNGPSAGQYQRATLNGGIVTFVTRPGDYPQTFFAGVGQVFPA